MEPPIPQNGGGVVCTHTSAPDADEHAQTLRQLKRQRAALQGHMTRAAPGVLDALRKLTAYGLGRSVLPYPEVLRLLSVLEKAGTHDR